MKRIYTLLIICILSISNIAAQDSLFTTRGETFYGKVMLYKNQYQQEVIDMKIGKKKRSFRIVEVEKYIQEGEVYKSIFALGAYKIGKVISEGEYLTQYLYMPTGFGKRAPFSQIILIKKNGNYLDLPKTLSFAKAVSDYLIDCPTVSQKVKDKTLGRKEVEEIIAEYNGCMTVTAEEGIDLETFKGMLQTFRLKLQESNKVDNKKAVRSMLKDYESKHDMGDEIPEYLIKGIADAVQDDLELTSLFKELQAL
jgi:hypothetical protein